MGFSRQEYWSGLLFPTPGDLPDPWIEPTSCISCTARWILPTSVTGEAPGALHRLGEKGFFELTTSPTHSLNLHHLHDIGISSQEINVKADSTNVN